MYGTTNGRQTRTNAPCFVTQPRTSFPKIKTQHKRRPSTWMGHVLLAISEQIVRGVLLGRHSLFLRPGHEAPDSFILQQLLPGSETLCERCRVVRSMNGAVAGPADVDGAIKHVFRAALLAVALVRAPASWNASYDVGNTTRTKTTT